MKRNLLFPLITGALLTGQLLTVSCGTSSDEQEKKDSDRRAAQTEKSLTQKTRQLEAEIALKQLEIDALRTLSEQDSQSKADLKTEVEKLEQDNQARDERTDLLVTFVGDVRRMEQEAGTYINNTNTYADYLKKIPSDADAAKFQNAIAEARDQLIAKVDEVEDNMVKSISLMQGFDGWKWTWKAGEKSGQELTDEEIQALDLANMKKLINEHYALVIESIKIQYEIKEKKLPEPTTDIPRAGTVAGLDSDSGRARSYTPAEVARIRSSGSYSTGAFDHFQRLATKTAAPFYIAKNAEELPDVVNAVMSHIKAGAAKSRPLDIVLTIDATGSMGNDINAVKVNMAKVVKELVAMKASGYTVRLGLAIYRDRNEDFVVATVADLDQDLDKINRAIQNIKVDGGGDDPEAVYDALRHVNQKMSWAKHAQRKVILVGDAPGHDKTVSGKIETEDQVLADFKTSGTELVVYPIIVPNR